MIIDSLTHILPREVSSNTEKFKKIDKLFDCLFDEKSTISNSDDLIENMKNNNIDKSIVGGFGWNASVYSFTSASSGLTLPCSVKKYVRSTSILAGGPGLRS